MRYLLISFLLSGCTINLQIETEYASQNGDGEISEQSQAESTATNTPTVDIQADIPGEL